MLPVQDYDNLNPVYSPLQGNDSSEIYENHTHEETTNNCKTDIDMNVTQTDDQRPCNILQKENNNQIENSSERLSSPLKSAKSLAPKPKLPEMGHSMIFIRETENNMKQFLEDTKYLNIPRTHTHFQQDLSFYYKWSTRRNIEKKRKLKPVFSRYWFKCFTTGAEK